MYKLLIVDDEPTVRFGLRNYFDWSAFGIEIMDEADDGDVALDLLGHSKPDIVLTDVRMPNMDGITLSKEIRERFPEIKIVFVSGHDDADYLKSALQVSAVDYIFKPVNLQELKAVVERVITVLEAEKRERLLTQDMQSKLKESMPLLREKFLMSLLRDGVPQPDRIRDRLEFLELRLPEAAAYWVIVVSIDSYAEVMENRSERDRQLLSYAVLNVVQELIDRYLGGYALEQQSGEFVGIIHAHTLDQEADLEERLFTLAGDIRENLQNWLKMSVTIGIGQRVSRLPGLVHSYAHAREAAGRKWFLGKNRIITMDSLEQEEESYSRFDHARSERLASILKTAEEGPLQAALEELFEGLSRNRRDGFKYARNVCLQILLIAGQLLLELNLQSAEFEEEEAQQRERLFKLETIGELKQLVAQHLTQVCEAIQEKRSGKANNLVERVRAIIERRYADNELTVAEIGKEVYLTDTYVSLLFKQETGRTVNEYLTHIRIEKAKELLSDPRNKFYDICYAVGYADPIYFSKLFKKVTGLTPSVYREHYA
ncbi:response regulator [Paenibacillus cremeus]|uniref:Response regulator n=1 Tax=Paenibacillus cremeus TaxID=2163881 RepID=A0A559KFT2_9BACL|nr:response regulator [Paenibacillus cremeus]TVY10981.1 response regulator [Paenibacillus cremeus]